MGAIAPPRILGFCMVSIPGFFVLVFTSIGGQNVSVDVGNLPFFIFLVLALV
jgi:hypothetical protein